uniref:Uncharacterized protein MANES_01G233000 n=1 Tax=Rhizophora mucronata TaxID=61149 RepID=A0A2P2PJT9_RHIMU
MSILRHGIRTHLAQQCRRFFYNRTQSNPNHSHLLPVLARVHPSMDPKGTIVFSTVGRVNYGFDVFSVNLKDAKISPSGERRLTDGISINFNAQFVGENYHDDQAIVYISERTGAPRIYLTGPGLSNPEQLSFIPGSPFHDRPVIKNNRLYFVSAHEQPDRPFKSASAVYSYDLSHRGGITRLTPHGVVDYSPAISRSGKFIAVASYGSRLWAGEFHELHTDIVVFQESDPERRVVVCERGGWPTWSGDSKIFFHRQAEDGWWSIYQVNFPEKIEFSGFPFAPIRSLRLASIASLRRRCTIVTESPSRPGGVTRTTDTSRYLILLPRSLFQ